jgi:C_GCAxxG_C_C family probable redox protein
MNSKRIDEAVACFKSDFNCAQSVFSTYAEPLGLDKQTALRVSCAFGAGMARMTETCGAVTGALMVIGLKHGKARQGDDYAKEMTYDLTLEFVERFKEKHGTIVCRELLGCDIGTEEGKRFFDENKYEETRCAKFVADAVTILEEIL